MTNATLLLTLLLACQPAPQGDPELDRLRSELDLLRKSCDHLATENVKLRLELFDVRIRLARKENKPKEEFRILEENLSSPHPELITAAFRELARLTPEERRSAVVPNLLERFDDESETFKTQAVLFLGRISSPEAGACVLKAARDPSPAVRLAAASALKSAPDEASVKALLALLGDAEKQVRLEALDSLAVARREEAVPRLIGALSLEKDEDVLVKTVDALGTIGSPAAGGALTKLLVNLRSDRDRLLWSCINSLGRIGDERAAEHLRPYLGAVYAPNIRTIAIQALGKMKDRESLPRFKRILKKDPEEGLRQAAAAAIGLMASPEEIEATLLAAYLDEKAEGVRREIWTAMRAAAGEHFDVLVRLATELLKHGRRVEAEEVCTLLHPRKTEGEARERHLELERAVAEHAFKAKAWKSASAHYGRLVEAAPEDLKALDRLATCREALEKFEEALETRRTLAAKLAKNAPEGWENRKAILALLERKGNPGPFIEEAHAALAAGPPEQYRKAFDASLKRGAVKLALLLEKKDETARKMLPRVGGRIILALATALGEEGAPSAAILNTGNAITGTSFTPDAAAEAAAAWRAWHKKKNP